MQWERNFIVYQDLEFSFEKCFSFWFEFIGDWGEGVVKLFEILIKEEVYDNIVVFWQLKQLLVVKSEYIFIYWLYWGFDVLKFDVLVWFIWMGVGRSGDDSKLFVLELMGDCFKGVDFKVMKGVVMVEKVDISNIVI